MKSEDLGTDPDPLIYNLDFIVVPMWVRLRTEKSQYFFTKYCKHCRTERAAILLRIRILENGYSDSFGSGSATSLAICFLFLVDLHPMTHVGSRRMFLDPDMVPPLAGFRLYPRRFPPISICVFPSKGCTSI
jgi:hypothetical protein